MCRSPLIIAFVAAPFIYAQAPPAFDVASVKLVDPKDGTVSKTSYGEFMGSLRYLVRAAYGLDDYRVAGGPKWMDDDKFSVVYKPVSPQANLMLRSLLADRFRLASHTETKELPIYALTVAKGGPKMEKADKPGGTSAGGGMIGGTMDMSRLATYLSSVLGRGVIERTGLTGTYRVSLRWTPDDHPPSADSNTPSLVTAIQEQLGLKLESTKGPVDILVIDHAEKPSPN